VERWTGKDILKAQNNKNENYSLLYTSHELSTNALHCSPRELGRRICDPIRRVADSPILFFFALLDRIRFGEYSKQ